MAETKDSLSAPESSAKHLDSDDTASLDRTELVDASETKLVSHGDETQLIGESDETRLVDAAEGHPSEPEETQLAGADVPDPTVLAPLPVMGANGADAGEKLQASADDGTWAVMPEGMDEEAMRAMEELKARRAAQRKSKFIKIGIAAGAIAAVVGGFFLFRNLSAKPNNQASVQQTAMAERADFTISVQGTGSLSPASQVVVTPEVSGIIESVPVTEGQNVAEGEVLFTIRSSDVEKLIKDAEEGVSKAQKDVDKAYEDYNKIVDERNAAASRHDTAQAAADDATARAQAAYDAAYNPIANKAEADFANAQASYEKSKALINPDGKQQAYDDAAAVVDAAKQKSDEATAAVAVAQKHYDDAPEAEKAKALEELNKAKQVQSQAYDNLRKAEEAFGVANGVYKQAIEDMKPVDARLAEATTAHSNALAAAASAGDNAKSTIAIPEVPPFDESTYTASLDSAQASIDTAEQARATAERTLQEANEKGEKRTVKAPKTGTLITLSAQTGAAVGGAEGGTTTSPSSGSGALAAIADVSQMRVSMQINEVDITNVKVGQRAKVTFSSIQGLEQEARVVDVATTAAGASDGTGGGGGGVASFNVVCMIPKPDKRLKPGMTANVTIYTSDIPMALVVPNDAVLELSDGTSVDVVTNAEELAANPEAKPVTERRKVQVGEKNSTQTVITSGLYEGDVVLVGGASSGLEGMSIEELSSLSEEELTALAAAESSSAASDTATSN